jgi:hypothetical protein
MSEFFVFLIASHLIWLHAPDGGDISVNIDEVVSMRGPKEQDTTNKLFTEKAGCLINTTDGRFITVRETCKEVMRIFVDTERRELPKE